MDYLALIVLFDYRIWRSCRRPSRRVRYARHFMTLPRMSVLLSDDLLEPDCLSPFPDGICERQHLSTDLNAAVGTRRPHEAGGALIGVFRRFLRFLP